MSRAYGVETKMKVLAICSGGLDSVSFLGKYIGKDMEVMTFNYGQKANTETERLREICKFLNLPLKIIDITFMAKLWKGTQLTDDTVKVENEYTPSVVVPLRNGVMLMIGMAYAYSIKADKIIYGSHTGDIGTFDHNGHTEFYYPDCSPIFANSLTEAGKAGTFLCDKKVELEYPAMLGIGKLDLVKLGYEKLGFLLFRTWSCYKSGNKQCGKCESCINRKNAFKNAKVEDKTEYDN